ncbi:Golgi to ER traffic protein 4 homolog [Venturia canescens]|uniref:Golgi to ER traffic protein 4 homolog n=1 Tax=Venturia canescens TaxID=32260 RepID=UPI001C9C7397|nr:Golgi to ER traffic protein 4 homolog [Venturia canescens]
MVINMASRYNQGVSRVLEKLKISLNSGNYYEAHQMYRTLYFRLLGQKDYANLKELLCDGSRLLLERDQHVSGADLGILYVDVLNKSATVPHENVFEQIAVLFSIMKAGTPERETFLHRGLKWSTKGSNYKWGHPDLHKKIAQVYWREKNYPAAKQHFLYSKDGSGCAEMLVELHQQRGYTNEIDLFIAQAVLEYLCLQDKVSAQEVFDTYTSRHPKINNGPPYLLPLLNFLFFLLKTVETGKLAVFTVLCEQYQLSINRDPTYRTYLDKIGQIFFKVPPPRPNNHGFLGSILQSFLTGLAEEYSEDEDDSDGETRHHSRASTSQTMHDLD